MEEPESPNYFVDPKDSYQLTDTAGLLGATSWRLKKPRNQRYKDYLATPPFAMPMEPAAFVEVWVWGKVEPHQALFITTWDGQGDPKPLCGLEWGIGPARFNRWTRIAGKIHPDHRGKTDLRLMFVASQEHPSSGIIDLYIDRIKVTTFDGSGTLSDNDLAFHWTPTDVGYTLLSGTSMATPLVAGAAALIRESLLKRGNQAPSAKLLKAILINTADPLPAFSRRPNQKAGWGRVNVRLAIQSNYVLVDDTSLEIGESATTTVKVIDKSELRATVVWADPPGSELVNDLDLTLIEPGEKRIIKAGPDGKSQDTVNNVEGIDVREPQLGVWTIKVERTRKGKPTKYDPIPQPFALVVSGGIDITRP